MSTGLEPSASHTQISIGPYEGLYYLNGSGLTGWKPNPNKYATATSLAGPWTEF